MYINDDAFDQLNTTYLALVSTEEGEFDKNKVRDFCKVRMQANNS